MPNSETGKMKDRINAAKQVFHAVVLPDIDDFQLEIFVGKILASCFVCR